MIWLIFAATVLCSLGSFTYVLLQLSPETTQGFVQKIFFFHVPAAFTMYVALFMAAAFSALYLMKKKTSLDLMARASMTTAFIFSCIVIVSGPIWAKPIWGVYWTWDPRLTTTFVVFVLLIAYLFVRRIYDAQRMQSRGATIGSILCLFALLDVPLIHWSVKLWRGIHPSVLKNSEGLPEDFRLGLEFMILSFFLIGFCIFWILWKLEKKNA